MAGAVLLLAKAPRLGWLIGGVSSALTFAAYCITRTIGIPGMDPSADIGNWLQPLGVVSLIVEVGALLLAVIALSDRYNLRTHHEGGASCDYPGSHRRVRRPQVRRHR